MWPDSPPAPAQNCSPRSPGPLPPGCFPAGSNSTGPPSRYARRCSNPSGLFPAAVRFSGVSIPWSTDHITSLLFLSLLRYFVASLLPCFVTSFSLLSPHSTLRGPLSLSTASSLPKVAPSRVMGFRDLVLFYVVTGISLRWIATAAGHGPSSLVIWFAGWLFLYIPLALSVIHLSSRYP